MQTEEILFGEEWKTVKFNFEFVNDYKLEVSNYGRLRASNKIFKNHLIRGSLTEGYKIIRLKFYKPRDQSVEKQLKEKKEKILDEARKLKAMSNGLTQEELEAAKKEIEEQKKKLSKKFQTDLKKRGFNYHNLIHRLVALYFLPPPKPEQTIVAHLDFNKLNNNVSNLAWMSSEENYKHQQKSPYVIKDQLARKTRYERDTKVAKLTITRVMFLKKLLKEGKPIKELVKQFKISDTQILRIKRGENWTNIEAAE